MRKYIIINKATVVLQGGTVPEMVPVLARAEYHPVADLPGLDRLRSLPRRDVPVGANRVETPVFLRNFSRVADIIHQARQKRVRGDELLQLVVVGLVPELTLVGNCRMRYETAASRGVCWSLQTSVWTDTQVVLQRHLFPGVLSPT